ARPGRRRRRWRHEPGWAAVVGAHGRRPARGAHRAARRHPRPPLCARPGGRRPRRRPHRPRRARLTPKEPRMSPILERLRGRLIVSCQAYPGEPLRVPEIMQRMAQAVVAGGAAGLRAQGLEDIPLIAASTDVPLTGLWKDGEDDVFITPTLEHALAVAEAGADIVALDGTRRPRPDGRTLGGTIAG